jgi:hypothetical protein
MPRLAPDREPTPSRARPPRLRRSLQHSQAAPLIESRTARAVREEGPCRAPTNRHGRAVRPTRRTHPRIQPRRMKPSLRTLHPRGGIRSVERDPLAVDRQLLVHRVGGDHREPSAACASDAWRPGRVPGTSRSAVRTTQATGSRQPSGAVADRRQRSGDVPRGAQPTKPLTLVQARVLMDHTRRAPESALLDRFGRHRP